MRAEKQSPDQALQTRVRRITTNHMKKRIVGNRAAKPPCIWTESIKNLRVSKFQLNQIDELICRDRA